MKKSYIITIALTAMFAIAANAQNRTRKAYDDAGTTCFDHWEAIENGDTIDQVEYCGGVYGGVKVSFLKDDMSSNKGWDQTESSKAYEIVAGFRFVHKDIPVALRVEASGGFAEDITVDGLQTEKRFTWSGSLFLETSHLLGKKHEDNLVLSVGYRLRGVNGVYGGIENPNRTNFLYKEFVGRVSYNVFTWSTRNSKYDTRRHRHVTLFGEVSFGGKYKPQDYWSGDEAEYAGKEYKRSYEYKAPVNFAIGITTQL
jgi:hypothetical protein